MPELQDADAALLKIGVRKRDAVEQFDLGALRILERDDAADIGRLALPDLALDAGFQEILLRLFERGRRVDLKRQAR